MKWVSKLILKPWFPAAFRWRLERRREKLKGKKTILGLTMIELLISITIVALLSTTTVFVWRGQKVKAMDARRKDDLHRYQVVFEDYFNDNGCYPTVTEMADCGGDSLRPYLDKVLCDPVTKEPYGFYPLSDCSGYELYTLLHNTTDPDIAKLGCSYGCGSTGEYNYGIASGVSLTRQAGSGDTGGDAGGTPSNQYACDPHGQCNLYADPEAAGCPITFTDASTCQAACDENSVNWCAQ